jgi:hypothetical protein
VDLERYLDDVLKAQGKQQEMSVAARALQETSIPPVHGRAIEKATRSTSESLTKLLSAEVQTSNQADEGYNDAGISYLRNAITTRLEYLLRIADSVGATAEDIQNLAKAAPVIDSLKSGGQLDISELQAQLTQPFTDLIGKSQELSDEARTSLIGVLSRVRDVTPNLSFSSAITEATQLFIQKRLEIIDDQVSQLQVRVDSGKEPELPKGFDLKPIAERTKTRLAAIMQAAQESGASFQELSDLASTQLVSKLTMPELPTLADLMESVRGDVKPLTAYSDDERIRAGTERSRQLQVTLGKSLELLSLSVPERVDIPTPNVRMPDVEPQTIDIPVPPKMSAWSRLRGLFESKETAKPETVDVQPEARVVQPDQRTWFTRAMDWLQARSEPAATPDVERATPVVTVEQPTIDVVPKVGRVDHPSVNVKPVVTVTQPDVEVESPQTQKRDTIETIGGVKSLGNRLRGLLTSLVDVTRGGLASAAGVVRSLLPRSVSTWISPQPPTGPVLADAMERAMELATRRRRRREDTPERQQQRRPDIESRQRTRREDTSERQRRPDIGQHGDTIRQHSSLRRRIQNMARRRITPTLRRMVNVVRKPIVGAVARTLQRVGGMSRLPALRMAASLSRFLPGHLKIVGLALGLAISRIVTMARQTLQSVTGFDAGLSIAKGQSSIAEMNKNFRIASAIRDEGIENIEAERRLKTAQAPWEIDKAKMGLAADTWMTNVSVGVSRAFDNLRNAFGLISDAARKELERQNEVRQLEIKRDAALAANKQAEAVQLQKKINERSQYDNAGVLNISGWVRMQNDAIQAANAAGRRAP